MQFMLKKKAVDEQEITCTEYRRRNSPALDSRKRHICMRTLFQSEY